MDRQPTPQPHIQLSGFGSGIMGFTAKDDDNEPEQEYVPNRAERRAMTKRLKATQRRGQRAYERTLRNQS